MSAEYFNKIVGQLGAEAGIEDLSLNAENLVTIECDEEYDVHLQVDESGDQYAIFTAIGEVGEENREATYQMLLSGNVLWRGTAGATLGVDENNTIWLCYSSPINEINAEDLEAQIDRFLELADDWQNRIHLADSFEVPASEAVVENPNMSLRV